MLYENNFVEDGTASVTARNSAKYGEYVSNWRRSSYSIPGVNKNSAASVICTSEALMLAGEESAVTCPSEYSGCVFFAEKNATPERTLTTFKKHLLLRKQAPGSLSVEGMRSIELSGNHRVNFIRTSPSKELLLLAYGSLTIEVRNSCTLQLVKSLNSFSLKSECIGVDFLAGPGLQTPRSDALDGQATENVWIGFAIGPTIDFRLSSCLFCWELNQNPESILSQKMPLPKTTIGQVVLCQKADETIVLANDKRGLYLCRQEMRSDFAGPMYPPGFIVLSEVVNYIEAEDELDVKVKSEVVLAAPSEPEEVPITFSYEPSSSKDSEDNCPGDEKFLLTLPWTELRCERTSELTASNEETVDTPRSTASILPLPPSSNPQALQNTFKSKVASHKLF